MLNETYDNLEKAVQDAIRDVCNAHSIEDGKTATEKVKVLTELLLAADRDQAEYYDKKERRETEKERNEATAQIERDKVELTWPRVTLELVKTFGPLTVYMICYGIFQTRVMRNEDVNGRLTSDAARDLHLPPFFNFLKK